MLARRAPIKRTAMKVKRRKPSTAIERRHLQRVADMPCLVCGAASTVHHVTSDGHQRLARVHKRTVPLCPAHHMIQFGDRESVEALGHAGFTATYGIDLLAVADRLWNESMKMEAGNDG